MLKPHSAAFVFAAFALASCSATMTQRWPDDFKNGKLRGGVYTYLNQGAGFVIHTRQEDGLEQARAWCGPEREPFVLSESDSQSLGTQYQPTFSYTSGTVTAGGQTANFYANTSGGSWVTTIRDFHSTGFLCPDAQQQEAVYALTYKNSPRCVSVPAPWTPGATRIKHMWHDEENDPCPSEGWVRINVGADSRHLFVGPAGLASCKRLAEAIINQQLTSDKFGIFVRKALNKCPSVNLPLSPVETAGPKS